MADTGARLMPGGGIPVGVVTALIGAPFFLWLLRRSRLSPIHLRTGATVEKAVLVPLFGLLTLAFLYLNTAARSALDPIVQLLALSR